MVTGPEAATRFVFLKHRLGQKFCGVRNFGGSFADQRGLCS